MLLTSRGTQGKLVLIQAVCNRTLTTCRHISSDLRSSLPSQDSDVLPIPVISKLAPLTFEQNRELRKRHLSPSLKAHYDGSPAGPIKLASGKGTYLYDVEGKKYLDCVNNVCHVGHCHPRIVQAASAQLARLNTNSRYLHDNIVRLAERITSLMPNPLEVAIFVNSGSEANDLALRLARNHTQRQDVYCVDGAYHGNSTATLAISPYNKYSAIESPIGTVKLTCPDSYRLGLSPADTTEKCVAEFLRLLDSRNEKPAAFIVESLICCGGQVVLPPNYLKRMHALIRERGGLAIADEVQAGFGRVGDHMWAFESQVPSLLAFLVQKYKILRAEEVRGRGQCQISSRFVSLLALLVQKYK